ncbi:MAG: hypothetical protein HDT28_02085 [Clostridiales bacterium]|nr:hypothetical protein [Clostridiales bacterium]
MFGRNKFKKLKREDVVNAIIEQTKQQEDLENGILAKSAEVEKLMERGRKEKNRDIKLLCAKKINTLQEEIKRDTKRAAFLIYNVKLLEKLKAAIDDNQFIENTTKLPLNKLLSDQKALAAFLQSSVQNRTAAEDALTSADELFGAYEQAADNDQSPIYATSSSDDELLAMFEMQEQLDSESTFDSDFAADSAKRTDPIEG